MALGETAVRIIEKTAAESLQTVEHELLPAAQAAADALVIRATGAITEAAGALCLALGGLPGAITDALDGMTITIKIERRTT
jgi:hypothetical protein